MGPRILADVEKNHPHCEALRSHSQKILHGDWNIRTLTPEINHLALLLGARRLLGTSASLLVTSALLVVSNKDATANTQGLRSRLRSDPAILDGVYIWAAGPKNSDTAWGPGDCPGDQSLNRLGVVVALEWNKETARWVGWKSDTSIRLPGLGGKRTGRPSKIR